MSTAKAGDKVKVHYTGRLEGGPQFDSSVGGDPIDCTAGGPELIPGFSKALVGMSAGDKKTVTIPPEEAYGPYQTGMTKEVPRAALPPQVEEGMPLRADIGGQEVILWVTALDQENATLDANHPLAGKTLVFDLEVVEVAG